jgi:hypothetical protein
MRFVAIGALTGLLLVVPASAQKIELKFDALAAKASDKSEVDLDGALLKLVTRHGLAKDKDGNLSAGDFLSGVQEIHVRNYEFDKAGAYSDQDLEPLRKQVGQAAGWSRIVHVKEKDENTEIFVLSQGDKISSCLILSAESKELTVVYIMGTLTLAQMKDLVHSDIAYNLAGLGNLAQWHSK